MRVQFLSWQPPRHPLLRLLLALAGAAVLGFFTVFGLVIAAAVMAVLALRGMWRQLAAAAGPAQSPRHAPRPVGRSDHPARAGHGVIEGEYRVVPRR